MTSLNTALTGTKNIAIVVAPMNKAHINTLMTMVLRVSMLAFSVGAKFQLFFSDRKSWNFNGLDKGNFEQAVILMACPCASCLPFGSSVELLVKTLRERTGRDPVFVLPPTPFGSVFIRELKHELSGEGYEVDGMVVE